MKHIKNYKSQITLSVILIVLGFAFGWFETLNKGPYSLHQWRQADCLSITQNYVNNNLNFFEPEIHWQGPQGHGKTVSEFPLVYFIVATIWKFISPYHFFYRALTFLLSLLALFALFKISRRFINAKIFQFAPVIFVLGSPLYVYYANNFLMNIYAFNLVIIGWYFFVVGFLDEKPKSLILSSLFFLLAALLKITALFNPLIAVFIYAYSKWKILNFKNILVIIGFFFLLLGSWYTWSIQYNQANNYGIFLQGILPIWELSEIEISNITQKLWDDLRLQFLSIPNQVVFVLLLGVSIFYFKKLSNALKITFPLLFLGFGLYILLFFQVFDVHDYYLTNFLIVPLFVIFSGIYLLEKNAGLEKIKIFVPILLLAGLAFSVAENRAKYYAPVSVKSNLFLISQEKIDLWNWYHWHYGNTFYLLEKNKSKIQEIIPNDKKVISIPDESINITLYLINRKGNTDFGYSNFTNQEKSDFFKSQGAEFLIINDSTALSRPEINSLEKHLIFEDGNLSVFKI